MSVRFVIGRAGSGKTWRCLEAVRARLRENAGGGSKLILLVPEQAGFQMERALIETPDVGGCTRCEVLSFQRLAYRIFAETGLDPRRADQTIGTLGRMMVIRRLIRRERSALQVLHQTADKSGVLKQVAATFDELMHEQVEPQILDEMKERIAPGNPLAAAKIADLTRLYRAYLDYLIDDRLDPAEYLKLAAERLGQCTWLAGAEVWVDGFAGFTRQEYHLLGQLARHVADVEITMLVDPQASAIGTDTLPTTSFSLMARTERTLVRLKNELRQAGVDISEAVRLDNPRRSRFVAPELAQLERGLFDSPPRQSEPLTPTALRVLEFSDRRSEVEAAVAEIQRLTRESDPPMRYRDIAVIVRDLSPYHDLFSAALSARQIPCFIDRRQPTTHHPLVELVRGLLAVAADDCRGDSVRLTLKTGLLGISDEDADLLENYLIAHGIAGRAAWNEAWPYTRMFKRKGEEGELTESQKAVLERVNKVRRQWLEAVSAWLAGAVEQGEAPGRQWAARLYQCLEQRGVGPRLFAWAEADENDGRTHEAQMHRQVWCDFVELLDEFVRALGDDVLRVGEFRETLEAALAEFNLGLAPPTLDQVLVGAIERSRHPPIRAALILGFDERHFPLRGSEDPLLGDQERDLLASLGAEIGPSRRQQLLNERMLAYITLTRAGERLWLSYPRADGDGQPLRPSPYLRDVLAALPGLRVEAVGDPRAERSPRWISGVQELGGRLAGEFRRRAALNNEPQIAKRALWNSLYERARQQADWRNTLRRGLAGLRYENRAALESGLLAAALPRPLTTSVSQLERFAACPFAHFAEYLLRLEPRVVAELAGIDLGNVCHVILERFIGRLARDKCRLADLQDDEIDEQIDLVAEQLRPELAGEMLLNEARHAYLYDRSRYHLRRSARWQRDAARAGRYRPLAAEYKFGYEPAGAKLKLTTPKGRTVLLRGRIDRVDVAELGGELLGLVIDYKRTKEKRFAWTEAYYGLSLQLAGYLLALRQIGESPAGRPIRPVAALYLPLLEVYETLKRPDEAKSQKKQLRGIIDASQVNTIDAAVGTTGTASQFLSAAINKKDGAINKNTDLVQKDVFEAVLRHVGRRMGELADRLIDGEIQVKPYRLNNRKPCDFCRLMAVCRYDSALQAPIVLPPLGRKTEVVNKIMEDHGDG